MMEQDESADEPTADEPEASADGQAGNSGGAPPDPAAAEPDDDRRTYKVGYGRPPDHGKIKKGEVRNPKGKPKGTRAFKTDLRDMLKEPVSSTRNGKQIKISTQQAALMRLREKALKGDDRALDSLLGLAAKHNEEETAHASTKQLLDEDAHILANARERKAVTDAANPTQQAPIADPSAETEKEDDQ